MTQNLAPIVLFVYNRPNHTQKTVEALLKNKDAKNSDLFIFSDAAKNEEASKNVEDVRNYIKTISGFKSITIKEQTQNCGLAKSIISGVSEIVEKYGKIIVLEDDIKTTQFFLQYMNDALNFYEKKSRVWHVSGFAQKFYEKIGNDTFFTRHMNCWGWATWADRWKFYEKNPKAILARLKRKNISELTYKNKLKTIRTIKANISGKRNTWAVFWYCTIFLNDGLCLNSKRTFTQNIGMDDSGSHCGPSSAGFSSEICDNYPIKFETNIYETTKTRAIFEKNIANKKLILILSKGQNSNRLILNLNFHAFCLEYGIEYRNPTFEQAPFYLSPCPTTVKPFVDFLRINLLFGIFRNSSFVKKYFCIAWFASILGLVKFIVFNKDIEKKNKNCEKILLEAFEKNNLIFTGGWNFRVPHLLEKHRNELTKMYSLKPEFYENNDFYKKILKLKQEENILIGIHIRRGDYKEWRGGKYYFDDDIYEKYMNDFSQKLSKKTNQKQIFVIFSNDKVKFVENETLIISKEAWFIDHHIMSICDYIIGPLSTFTLWANYIGKNTLFCIRDDSGNIDNAVSDFCENDFSHTLGEEKAKMFCEKKEYFSKD